MPSGGDTKEKKQEIQILERKKLFQQQQGKKRKTTDQGAIKEI